MSIKEISDILLNANEPEDVFTGSTKEEIKKEVVRSLLYYRISTLSKYQRGSMENQPEFLKKIIVTIKKNSKFASQ